MWRVIVTASREYAHELFVHATLSWVLARRGPFWLKHGECPTGGDLFAHSWFVQTGGPAGCIETPFPADWSLGPIAGPVRNTVMVSSGADEVLAFLQPGAVNRGTQNTVNIARAAGIPVIAYMGRELIT